MRLQFARCGKPTREGWRQADHDKVPRVITRGFAAVDEPNVAVCLLPGTEIAFDQDVDCDRGFGLRPRRTIEAKVARFRQINTDRPHSHHDALEFPDGEVVLLTELWEGQHATVLQLPASPTRSEAEAQTHASVNRRAGVVGLECSISR